ncbi:MAG TPA: MBL fold metallo-hydrolase [Caldilineae bacterium]|jgi:metallo-beta-lactamase family protein|nr:MBL fold metallo-hydrolase [Caldilineae bacterium]
MKLTFLGAARTVTGSMHLLEVNGHRVLLDCGLFQGRRAETYERNLNFPFDPASIDALVLSHAHIDHSGNIPNLVKQGFRGNIWSTPATRDLCAAMLQDSGHIQEKDVEYVNKKRARKGLPPVEPLYTQEDAMNALPYFVSLGYDRPFQVVPGVQVTFLDAGHILGSAMVLLEITEGERTWRLLFSGDVGRKGLDILRDPTPALPADIIIMESTYGSRIHETHEEARQILRRVINETYRRRGKVIIPAFAVGRTQELVYELHQLTVEQKIPPLPIYVDSPLAVNVTEIFRLHPECYDEETRVFLAENQRKDPFGFYRLRYIRDVEQSKALNFLRDSAVIISASGMCESGRILHHLKNNIEDPNNTILFVGFQAEHTLGRRLLDGWKHVRIFGEEYEVRARIERIDGYSAHADRNELLEWVRPALKKGKPRIFLVHGELEAAQSLAQALRDEGVRRIDIPERGATFEFP